MEKRIVGTLHDEISRGVKKEDNQPDIPTELNLLPEDIGALQHKVLELMHEQEKTQQELNHYKRLVDNIVDVVWQYNYSKGKITYISPSIFQMCGYQPDEILTINSNNLMPPESWQKIAELENLFSQRGKLASHEPSVLNLDMAHYHKLGHTIWIETTIRLITDSEENIIEAIGVSRDINQWKKDQRKMAFYAEELEKINLVKDRFFSIIAHELRGPVGNMDNFLEYLIRNYDLLQKGNLLDDIQLIKESSQSVYDLLERLLVWARSQKSEIAFTPKMHNISRIVDSNAKLYSIALNDKKIRVVNNISPDIVAYFDYDMIKTVIRNLINNAIKFSHMGGEIIASAKFFSKDMLVISIKDSGIGIDKKTAENLFRLDVNQNSRPGTKGEKGTGLGLILCKDFVKKHGGNIWIESENGAGSCASFTIPVDHN